MRRNPTAWYEKLTGKKEVCLFDVAAVPALIVAFGPLVLLAVVAVLIVAAVVRAIVRIAREKRERSKEYREEERK